jgi:hypothetical protein
MYQQRVEAPKHARSQAAKLWAPQYATKDGRTHTATPRAGDKYVVVDEIIDDHVRLVIASWPRVGESGRLLFAGWRVSRPILALETLTGALNAGRRSRSQPERELRVGDTFLARAQGGNRWGFVIDVTGATRLAAKAAQLRVIAPPAEAVAAPEHRRRRRRGARMTRPSLPRPDAEPRSGSVARPVV